MSITSDPWFAVAASNLLIALAGFFAALFFYRKRNKLNADLIARQNIHHRRLIRLHDNIPGIVYQAVHQPNQGLKIIYISERIRDYSISPEEIYKNSKYLSSLLHPDDYLRFHISSAKSAQYLTPFHEEYRLCHKNGMSWIEERAVPTHEPDGTVLWDGMMIDITARKLAEEALHESEEKLKLMALALANSANGVLLAEVAGHEFPIVHLNPAFTDITGYSAAEATGKDMFFLHESNDAQPALLQLREAALKGEYCRVLLQNKQKNGEPFWSDFSLSPIRNRFNDVTHFVGVINDVTELENARLTAEKATAVKRDFLANMSHEIRTPLYGILGTIKLLSDSRLNGEQQQWVDLLGQTGDSLLNIINDILDFSKIESGSLQLHETVFNPVQLVNDVLQLQRKMAGDKPLVFSLDIDKNVPLYLIGDQERIRQIINNYLVNAIKFTEKGRITLVVELVDENRAENIKKVRFSVQDSGVGIAQDQQGHMFEKFTQADASISRRVGGTGLGLAICKQLAELMHGEVGVKSRLGEGSTFWFEASFLKHDKIEDFDENRLQAPAQRIRFGGQHILLAEDNPVNRAVTVAILTGIGLKVSVAENGMAAVKACETTAYDLVLMDVQMPVMGGLEASRLIRAVEVEAGRTAVPIIAFTANVLEGFHRECFDNGMDDYLIKPLREDQLAATLAKYLPVAGATPPNVIHFPAHKPLKKKHKTALDTIHLDALRALLGGQFDELCERFSTDTAARLSVLKHHAKQKDYQQISSVAHSVKSAALNMGAAELYERLREIEFHKGESDEPLPSLIRKTEKEFRAVQEALAQYRKNL